MKLGSIEMFAVVAALPVIEALARFLLQVHEVLHAPLAAARHQEGVAAYPDKLRAAVQIQLEATALARVVGNFGKWSAYTVGSHGSLYLLLARPPRCWLALAPWGPFSSYAPYPIIYLSRMLPISGVI
jgi:hypothetical protein